MDDADGGLRGLRARPGASLRGALHDHWALGWYAEAVDLGGSSSLNLLVGDADRRYVVRVQRPHVTPERLGAIHQARRALLAGDVPCAPPVPTRLGEPWVSFEGRLVEVEAYVDHDAVMDSWQRLEAGMAASLCRRSGGGWHARTTGGGAPPRRQRGTRAGGGAADHDRAGPLAGRFRLNRTPRPLRRVTPASARLQHAELTARRPWPPQVTDLHSRNL